MKHQYKPNMNMCHQLVDRKEKQYKIKTNCLPRVKMKSVCAHRTMIWLQRDQRRQRPIKERTITHNVCVLREMFPFPHTEPNPSMRVLWNNGLLRLTKKSNKHTV